MKNTVLQTVINRFPDLSDQITKLFKECESFREICEDYVLSLNSIRRIKSSKKNKKKNLPDFEEATKELEAELKDRLNKRFSNNKLN